MSQQQASRSSTSLPLKMNGVPNPLKKFTKSRKKSTDGISSTPEDNPSVAVGTSGDESKQKEKVKLQVVDRLKKLVKKEKKSAEPSPVANTQATPPSSAKVESTTEPSAPLPTVIEDGVQTTDEPAPTAEPDPSSATVARRIYSILSSVPPFYHAATPVTTPTTEQPPASPGDSSSAEAGQDFNDTRLLNLLSSSSAMNGSISKGKRSVWSILDRLSVKMATQQPPTDDQTNKTASGSRTAGGLVDNSIMLCAPLMITNDSQVTLARSEIISVIIDDEIDGFAFNGPFAGITEEQARAEGWWPWWPSKKPTPAPPKPPTKEVRIWIPSKTKVSLQASWWGFRIYLPPPVLKVLDDSQLEAAKRAAMLSAALQWLLNNVPAAGLPPQFMAVLAVVKGLVPIIGYIAGFIAWSWQAIKSFDKGQGVVLSATWLLPIALIPSSWDFVDPTPEVPDPAPEPPTSNPPEPTEPAAPPAPAPAPEPTPTPAPADPPSNPPAPPEPDTTPIGISPPPSIPKPDSGSPIIGGAPVSSG